MIAEELKNPLGLFDVSGKSAIVTGASGAFGRGVSIALGALGAKLTLVSGNADALEEVAEEVRSVGGEVVTVNLRPDTLEDAETMLSAALEAYGAVDMLAVASGFNKPGFIHEMPYEEWQGVMDANVRGAWFMAKAVGSYWIENERRGKVLLSGGLHPHYRDVNLTNARFLDLEITVSEADAAGAEDLTAAIDADTACVVVQNPDFFGHVKELGALAEACHAAGALLVVAVTEIISLGAMRPPGEMGADIVAAEGQSLGNGLNFGGPHVGLFAVRDRFIRQMPGRLAGETLDVDGKRGWVLTLSTREQHIRREKATSNICTNSGLCALAFSIHLSLLGDAGYRRLARLNHARAIALADALSRVAGIEVINETFFNEFTLRLAKPAAEVVDTLAGQGILAGVPVSRLYPGRGDLDQLLLVAATETVGDADIDRLAEALKKVL